MKQHAWLSITDPDDKVVEFTYWTSFCPFCKIIRIKVLECIAVFNEEERFGDKMKNMPETPNPSAGRILPLKLVAYRFDCSFIACGVIENNASNLVACNQPEVIQHLHNNG
ncbi:hypothetical protein FPOA_27816 [Fusarium poae]|uniref:Uncharacterized protein n=1 Tax=Fusarium poae TaxID=36050 RepID=A0A1B8A6N2_FUSPO|nr:hypothetical protein FPOA_27816 [Fusarium poae]